MTRTRVTLAVTAAVAGVVLGAGCTGSDAVPQTVPTPTPSTLTPSTRTPTVQPTTEPTTPTGPEEPVLPLAARGPGRAGAEAFVRYYIDLLNYAANTGDTTALRDAAAGQCEGCDDYATLYESTYDAGGWFRDRGWRPFGVFSRRERDHVTVLLQVEAPPVTYVKRSRAQPQRGSAEVYPLRFETARSNGEWTTIRFEGQ